MAFDCLSPQSVSSWFLGMSSEEGKLVVVSARLIYSLLDSSCAQVNLEHLDKDTLSEMLRAIACPQKTSQLIPFCASSLTLSYFAKKHHTAHSHWCFFRTRIPLHNCAFQLSIISKSLTAAKMSGPREAINVTDRVIIYAGQVCQ